MRKDFKEMQAIMLVSMVMLVIWIGCLYLLTAVVSYHWICMVFTIVYWIGFAFFLLEKMVRRVSKWLMKKCVMS